MHATRSCTSLRQGVWHARVACTPAAAAEPPSVCGAQISWCVLLEAMQYGLRLLVQSQLYTSTACAVPWRLTAHTSAQGASIERIDSDDRVVTVRACSCGGRAQARAARR